MTTPLCTVCNTNPSKYKCPTCSARYCSLPCSRQHSSTHPTTFSSPSTNQAPPRDRPGTTQRHPPSTPLFTDFDQDPEFQRLLARYPLLKTELAGMFALTLEPVYDPEETTQQEGNVGGSGRDLRGRGGRGRGFRGRGRGRGFSDRGGRGGNRGGGTWTREKGEREALSAIKRLRQGVGENERAEGMREFVALCEMRFGQRKTADGA